MSQCDSGDVDSDDAAPICCQTNEPAIVLPSSIGIGLTRHTMGWTLGFGDFTPIHLVQFLLLPESLPPKALALAPARATAHTGTHETQVKGYGSPYISGNARVVMGDYHNHYYSQWTRRTNDTPHLRRLLSDSGSLEDELHQLILEAVSSHSSSIASNVSQSLRSRCDDSLSLRTQSLSDSQEQINLLEGVPSPEEREEDCAVRNDEQDTSLSMQRTLPISSQKIGLLIEDGLLDFDDRAGTEDSRCEESTTGRSDAGPQSDKDAVAKPIPDSPEIAEEPALSSEKVPETGRCLHCKRSPESVAYEIAMARESMVNDETFRPRVSIVAINIQDIAGVGSQFEEDDIERRTALMNDSPLFASLKRHAHRGHSHLATWLVWGTPWTPSPDLNPANRTVQTSYRLAVHTSVLEGAVNASMDLAGVSWEGHRYRMKRHLINNWRWNPNIHNELGALLDGSDAETTAVNSAASGRYDLTKSERLGQLIENVFTNFTTKGEWTSDPTDDTGSVVSQVTIITVLETDGCLRSQAST